MGSQGIPLDTFCRINPPLGLLLAFDSASGASI
jgi:hypothetical protein